MEPVSGIRKATVEPAAPELPALPGSAETSAQPARARVVNRPAAAAPAHFFDSTVMGGPLVDVDEIALTRVKTRSLTRVKDDARTLVQDVGGVKEHIPGRAGGRDRTPGEVRAGDVGA